MLLLFYCTNLSIRLIPDVSITMQRSKAVMLTKVSRYEFEKLRHDNLSESQLEQELTARGSSYAAIRHHRNIHQVNLSSQSLSVNQTLHLPVSRGGRGRHSGDQNSEEESPRRLFVQIDKEPIFKSRNSGLCISTGTGSTSWIFNINKLVESLMKIMTTRFPLNWKVRREYSHSLNTKQSHPGHQARGGRHLDLQQLDRVRPRVSRHVLHSQRSNLRGNFSKPVRAETERESQEDQCQVQVF